MKMLVTLLSVGFLLAGCGRSDSADLQFKTELVSETETEDFDLSDVSYPRVVTNRAAAVLESVVNLLAGVSHKVLSSDQEAFPATVIGHAIPKGTAPFDLQGGKEVSKSYRKVAESSVGNNLVELEYKISYVYGLSYKGKGKYLANVRFTPVRVYTNPIWSVKAVAVSDAAVNRGTAEKPVAKLHFSVTFSLKGLGSATVTDEFTIDSETGKLDEDINPLSDEDS